MKKITLAYSPCPNDTFIFHALSAGFIDTKNYSFETHLDDVEGLNRSAESSRYQVTKLSAVAYLTLKERYTLLDAGGALGFGCGPLLVAPSETAALEKARIAVPGRRTTALALLRMWRPDLTDFIETGFDAILDEVASGRADAGVIIHEGRFIYQRYGLKKVVDLGEWWEGSTGMPVPLGVIAAEKSIFSPSEAAEISSLIRESLLYAIKNPEASAEYVKLHAQEMDDTVIRNHIDLYVNEFSLSLGEKGMGALRCLEERASAGGII